MSGKSGPAVSPQHQLMEVLPHLELTGIQFLELNARRLDYEPESDDLPHDIDGLGEEGVPEMGVAARQTDDQLLVKVQGTIRTESVQVRITAGATYSKAKPVQLDGPTVSIFIEKVAIMAMYPFIRQAVHDMSSRLGAPATLHLLRSGQVAMTEETYQDDAQAVSDHADRSQS